MDLSIIGKNILKDLKAVGVEAERLGYQAYFVGGVVRDVLLGRPSSDWDIVVEGQAIELAKALAAFYKSRLTVYESFGTATLTWPNGFVVDFAMARREYYPHPGSLPIVTSGSIKEDLFRRDFTINALAVVLNPQCFGELQDFYGGYDDLKKKKLRVMHEKSFLDDPTRILRAIRFESRLDFHLEVKTLRVLKAALAKDAPATVKPPRYFAEFRKIFSERHPVACLKRLADLNGLEFIFPGFKPDWTILSRVEKVVRKLKKNKSYFSKNWSGVFLLAFFARMRAQQVASFAKHFHLTKKEVFSLSGLGEVPALIKKLQLPGLRRSDIYEILDPVDLEIIYFIRTLTSVNMVTRRVDDFLKKSRLASLRITGEDLKDLGLKPGREMGALLHTLLMHKINGKIKNYQGEKALASQLVFQYQRG